MLAACVALAASLIVGLDKIVGWPRGFLTQGGTRRQARTSQLGPYTLEQAVLVD